MDKIDKPIRGMIPKLEDAIDAGTKESLSCTLFLTEGDSSKSFAVAGLGVLGRQKYGVFPLVGRVLNVRDTSAETIFNNNEINNIIQIVGLDYEMDYVNVKDMKSLRYGKIMILADQDDDGSHIKGLIINLIHVTWPALLKHDFLEEFITPIIKGVKPPEEDIFFYSVPKFEEWKQSRNETEINSYRFKYYKGLASHTDAEAKKYFSNFNQHRVMFKHDGPDDDANMIKAFSKKGADNRKTWLSERISVRKQLNGLKQSEPSLYETGTTQVTLTEFVDQELMLYSISNNIRSIPSLSDGLKPCQRKALFTCLCRKNNKEIGVLQLAGKIQTKTAHHHCDSSMAQTIIRMAQNYVSSNNINLFLPNGQFGNRYAGGNNHGQPRYLRTQLSSLTFEIFRAEDECLLVFNKDGNQSIEPAKYYPIIPWILINGGHGIGTGWSTNIPCYKPSDIVDYLQAKLNNKPPKKLNPWYKNFKGRIEQINDQHYITIGNVAALNESDNDGDIEITELPVNINIESYKDKVTIRTGPRYSEFLTNILLIHILCRFYTPCGMVKHLSSRVIRNITHTIRFDS